MSGLPLAMLRALKVAPELRAPVETAWAALAGAPAVVALPRVGSAEALLVRWLYRHALAAHPDRWWRLVAARGGGETLDRGLARGSAGWVWLPNGAPPDLMERLRGVHAHGLVAIGAEISTPSELASLWRDEDRLHLVAIDAALTESRRAACRAYVDGALVALGAPGSGRASLVAWTHTVVGDGTTLRAQGPDQPPGLEALGLFPELASWPPASRAQLLAALPGSRPTVSAPSAPARPSHPAFATILGDSAALRRALDAAARVAPTLAAVHLEGASGTGKELFARAIHDASDRAPGPYVAVNAATLHVDRAEAELFGWKRGAFTGSLQDERGYFGRAHGGTLFLDEIADLPPELRARLLRVLETGRAYRLGESTETAFDVRIITASHRPLAFLREEGRADLHQRLTAHVIRLPALAERTEDIPQLALYLLRSARVAAKLPADCRIDAAAAAMLAAAPWPDNVRQLSNVLRRAVLYMDGDDTLRVDHLQRAQMTGALRVPFLCTSTEPPACWQGLDDATRERLHRGLVRLPSLADRGAGELRTLIRAALLDREIDEAALARLVATRWRGGLTELDWRLRELQASAGSMVTLTSLGRVHPDLYPDAADPALWLRVGSSAPVRFTDGAVILGGLGATEVVLADARRSGGAQERLRAVLAGRWPDRLPLPGDGPTVLIARVGDEIRVLRPGPGEGAVIARGVKGGAAVRLGPEGELAFHAGLVLDGLTGGPIAVFAGQAAWEAHEAAAARMQDAAPEAPARRDVEVEGPLDPETRKLLVRSLVQYASNAEPALHRWLERQCASSGEAGRRLWALLARDARKSQIIHRQFSEAKNPGLLDELRDALAAQPGARRDRLPTELARMLDHLDATRG